MKKIDKELFPLVQAVSIIIILVTFPYYSAVALGFVIVDDLDIQNDNEKEEDEDEDEDNE